MAKKVWKRGCTSDELFIKWSIPFLGLKIEEDKRYSRQFFDLSNELKFYKFCNISANFKDTKMVDHVLKIARPGVIEIRCVNWKIEIIVFMIKWHMDTVITWKQWKRKTAL